MLQHLNRILLLYTSIHVNNILAQKNAANIDVYSVLAYFGSPFGGERGIRTPGPVTVNSFQDYRNRPLCHLSKNSDCIVVFSGANIKRFFIPTKKKLKIIAIFY